jgi:hypothetical protein
MEKNSLKKVIKEIISEIINENYNFNDIFEKFQAFKKNLPPGEHCYVATGGNIHAPSPKFNVFAYTNKRISKREVLHKTDDENEARSLTKKINDYIFGYAKPEVSTTNAVEDLKLSKVYTIKDSNFEIGKTDDVKQIWKLMNSADYPSIDPMTPEDKEKYLAYTDKQPKSNEPKRTSG